jgi:hypothetical protein
MVEPLNQERRRERRLDIRSVNMPFLGTRDTDQSSFQYLILDLSKSGIGFAIPKWVVNREGLKKGDTINFNLPIFVQGSFYKQGNLLWTRWDNDIEAQVCGGSLVRTQAPLYPIYISLDADSVSVSLDDFAIREDNLVYRVLKDTAFLKKGVEIYIGHLVPFLSRIAKYPPEEYPQLKGFLFSDIRERVTKHFEKLEDLYMTINAEKAVLKDLAKYIDLEDLRVIIDSEISIDIFRAVFSDENIMPYLTAIKDLEQKLFYNYNIIVLLYLHSLE